MMKLRRLIVVMGLMTLILNQGRADASETDLTKRISTHMEMIQEEREKIANTERKLLAQVVYAESNNQQMEGKIQVANVVLNRKELYPDVFGDSIEKVLSQKDQFSTWPALKNIEPNEDCYTAVDLAMNEYRDLEPVFFESVKGDSWHSRNLTFLYKIQDHNFYTF